MPYPPCSAHLQRCSPFCGESGSQQSGKIVQIIYFSVSLLSTLVPILIHQVVEELPVGARKITNHAIIAVLCQTIMCY